MDARSIINIIVAVAVFGLVFSIWGICVFLWVGQYLLRLQTIQRRLGIARKETHESRTLRLWRELQIQRDAESSYRPQKETRWERVKRFGYDAGLQAPIHTVFLGVFGVATLAFVVTWVAGGGILLGLGIGAAIVFAFLSYMRRRISKRLVLFERQFVDALSIAARALRAGHPLVGAFQLVSEEIGEPLGTMFFQVCQEQSLGSDLKDSLRKVVRTSSNSELRLFTTAVAIQLESGGNLADLMDSLGTIIRTRMRLHRRIRVLTSQTQYSKRILIALPIMLFFILNWLSPEYMLPLYTTSTGKYMLAVAISGVLLGAWAMNRLSRLSY
jgi:tight adherence protein B